MPGNPAGPNVLLLVPHDLGDHLGCYGHRTVRSPNLDALAADGARLSNCFTTAPECSPSRGGMLTGLQPHQNGLMGLANFGWNIRPEVPHLARRLRDAGYRTRLFGFQHETAGPPEDLGYEQVHCQDNKGAAHVCAELGEFLGSAAARRGPWFAHAGFSDVHRPWHNETQFDPDEIEVPPYLPDLPEVRCELAHFHQNILDMDRAVGGALDALDESGLRENTAVVFTTDHGIGFPRAKATFYDPGIRVTMLLRWPGEIPEGTVADPLVSNLDFTPTVLEMCGAPVPDGIEGRSFLPLLRGEPYRERDAVFGSLFYDVSYDPMHYVRTRRHKYIRSFAVTDDEKAGADPEVLCTHSAGCWVRCDDYLMVGPSWRAIDDGPPPPPPEELYDLERDPHEQHNLAASPEHREALDEMRGRLREMMEATGSPLLDGHVPPPPEQRAASRKYRPGGPMYQENRQ